VEEVPRGTVICKEGDMGDDAIFLVAGGVELVSQSTTVKRVVQGGTPDAEFAVVQVQPRPFTITTTTDARILRVDSSSLDRVAVLDELTTLVTVIQDPSAPKFKGDSEWLEEMLRNELFSRLPEENLGPLMLKMEAVTVKAGDVIVRQGDPGKFYYIIKEGRFVMSRKDEHGKVRIIKELGKGGIFGVESLFSGGATDVSFVSVGKGTLMRLSKKDFEELLKRPLLRYVTIDEARQMTKSGAGLLDVRSEEECKREPLRGGVNVPASKLRERMDKLDRGRRYIVCCRTGVQSEVAAFLLAQRGYEAYALKGGLKSVAKKT